MNQKLMEKIKESLAAVLPVTGVVLLLSVTITPMPLSTMAMFLVGAVLLIVGMGFFTLGADMAMMPIGEKVGVQLTKTTKVWLIALACFIIDVAITIAEPDLTVLAQQTPGVPNMVLILCVATGVGLFLILAFLRSLFSWNLNWILIICYNIVFTLACFVLREFLAVAFDSGGVASGPITATFLLPFAMGARDAVGGNILTDAFGIVAMVAMTPLIIIQLIGLLYRIRTAHSERTAVTFVEEEIIDLTNKEE